ncbi:MAG: DUF1127 domain-containing protein [Bacteroidota bacterium]|nr:DUF1127 domain-containing protein [Kiloniellaceae bacterium]
MQHAASHRPHAVAPGAVPSAAGLLRAPRAVLARLAAWQRQAEERHHLLQLSDHQLQDMGLTRGAVEDMARRAFWSR